MNIKDIAATLAILGSGTLVMTGCGKEQPATEVPAGDDAVAPEAGAEASCGADDHPAEGHCGGEGGGDEEMAEGSCGGEKAEGSCGGQ